MTKQVETETAPAYSYIRFSHPDQAKGDSLRRQAKNADDWCEKHGVTLNKSTTLHDLGTSAFTGDHRKNPDRNALALFLKGVESGKVPKGSYLIVEALDRLTREDIQPALILILGLLQAGIRVVQLKPSEVVYDSKSEAHAIMLMIVELMRGHSESAVKSERVGAAWAEKRTKARNGGVMTRRLPGWVEERDGKLRLIPERAAVVKTIFRLAAKGLGYTMIVKALMADKAPAFGEYVIREGRHRSACSGKWIKAYVARILKDRRALGELQPMKGRKPDGPPVLDYFPAVVTEAEWLQARAGATQRRRKPGRTSQHVNLFSGLLQDARGSGSYCSTPRMSGNDYRKAPADRELRRVLVTTASTQGLGPTHSFPYPVFEAGILDALKEIDPRELFGGDQSPDETLELSAQLAAIEVRIGELEAELLKGDVAALARALRTLEDQKKDVAARLAAAREKAANPLSEAWGEAQTLADALAAAPDRREASLHLRSILRRLVESIWILVVPRGSARLCWATIFFADSDRYRTYLILYRPAKSNGSARVDARSWVRSFADTAAPGGLSIKNRETAEAALQLLAALPLEQLEKPPRPKS